MSKIVVREGYDKIAENYSATRDQFNNVKYLVKLNTLLKPNSTILDIGCGAGVPIDRFLISKGFQVKGIDISEKQIELARRNVPEADYQIEDMSELREEEYLVDAVVAFYAIFHISREEHAGLLQKLITFLPVGGLILITMGAGEHEGVEDNFHGVKMFWSHFGAEKNKKLVEEAGFEVLLDEIDGSANERHQIILARKK